MTPRGPRGIGRTGGRRAPFLRLLAALFLAPIPAVVSLATPAGAEDALPVDPRAGTVRIYESISSEATAKLVRAFGRHFPNLKIEFVRAGSVETIKRFIAERLAGRIAVDLIHVADPGGFDYLAAKGWLDPRLTQLPLVAAYRDGFYDPKAGWIALRATGIAPMYNTQLVRKEDIPRTWKELIESKWKGRIALSDPNRAGSSFSHLYAMWKLYGEDYLAKLGRNDVLIAGDGAATRNAVAQGERDLAPVSEYDAFRIKREGAPVDVAWFDDGTVMVPAPLALVKDSPNSENALALAEYMLSREGQQIVSDVIASWSARRDVKAPDSKPELDDIKLAHVDWGKAGEEKAQLTDLYFKYFQAQ